MRHYSGLSKRVHPVARDNLRPLLLALIAGGLDGPNVGQTLLRNAQDRQAPWTGDAAVYGLSFMRYCGWSRMNIQLFPRLRATAAQVRSRGAEEGAGAPSTAQDHCK